MTERDPIPQEWVRDYVATLLAFAKKVGPESVMGKAAMGRADHAMDLVQAWRETGAVGEEGRTGEKP